MVECMLHGRNNMIYLENANVSEVFSDFIIDVEFDNDLKQLTDDVYKLKDQYPSQGYSNVGGWQSPGFSPQSQVPESLSKLQWDVYTFVHTVIGRRFHKSISKEQIGWWTSINEKHCYNSIHHHGRTDVIAIAYIKAQPNSGDLVVSRNDGSTYTGLDDDNTYSIPANAGRLIVLPGHVWHYVNENNNDDDRISVSYNFYVQLKWNG